MASRAKRQRHKYSPIHMVTATGPPSLPSPSQHDPPTTSASDKENQPPPLGPLPYLSHSQLYDDHSTPPSQRQQPSPERYHPPSRPIPSLSPPRKPKSAFTPLSPFTPLSFRDVHNRPTKPLQPHSASQSQQRPVESSALFRPIPPPLPSYSVPSTSFPASVPSTPFRPPPYSSPLRPSPSTKREPPPAPSSYSTEKARFLRSLPHAHRYDAIVSALEDEEQALEQMAAEWSESLTAPTTPPLSSSGRRLGGAGNDNDVPATPPSVCSLSSSSVSSVGSFASPISAALSAIMERDSSRRSRGGLEDDEILTPSPDVVLGSETAAGSVPSLPASIFSSVFSQRLPLPPLTAEAKQLMVQSPLRPPPATAAVVARPPPPASFPALQPTAFTFAAPQLAVSTSASGEWKGVMHIDEDRLYNATPTQSSASCSPVSSSSYLSPSAFLSQASAASAASAASTAVPSSNPDSSAAIPQLERVPNKEEEDEEQRALLSQVEVKLAISQERREETPLQVEESAAEMQDVSAESPKKRRRSLRSPAKATATSAAQQPISASQKQHGEASSIGKRRRMSRTRRSVDSLSQLVTSGQVGDIVQGAVAASTEDSTAVLSEDKPKRRRITRVVSVELSQPGESISSQPAAGASEGTTKRLSKSLTPPFSAAATTACSSSSLSSTQPDISLSQRSHRISRSSTAAAWQCNWCTWEKSSLQHMSCDMCGKARGSRPDTVVEIETKTGGKARRGRTSKRAATSQSEAAVEGELRDEGKSQGSELSAGEASETSDGLSTGTPVSQQLVDTPASSSSLSQSAETGSTVMSQPVASPPSTHSPALSPATLLGESVAEEEVAAAQQQWALTQPALSPVWTGSRRRRRHRLDSSQNGDLSATQTAEVDGEQVHSPTLQRRRRRKRW